MPVVKPAGSLVLPAKAVPKALLTAGYSPASRDSTMTGLFESNVASLGPTAGGRWFVLVVGGLFVWFQ